MASMASRARWRQLLDWWFSFQSREAFLCFPCHTCKRHSNKLLCGGACRHGGASYRRLGACAVTDFADALHGTSARNAALHGCLKGVGLARQCLPVLLFHAVEFLLRPGQASRVFLPPPVAFLLPPIADPSLPAASNDLRGTAGNTDCHTGAACSNSLRTDRRGLHARGRHQQCRACTCQSIVDVMHAWFWQTCAVADVVPLRHTRHECFLQCLL